MAIGAGGTSCSRLRRWWAATIATASKAICSRIEMAAYQPTRRRLGALGRRPPGGAAKGRMDGAMAGGARVGMMVAVMGIRRARDNRSCGDTMPSACVEKGREYVREVILHPQGQGRGLLLNLPVWLAISSPNLARFSHGRGRWLVTPTRPCESRHFVPIRRAHGGFIASFLLCIAQKFQYARFAGTIWRRLPHKARVAPATTMTDRPRCACPAASSPR
jgi:hypothetical protein